MAWGPAHAAQNASPGAPTNVVVGNCNDSGPDSLRDALAAAANEDVIDLTRLQCSLISLTTGALVIGQADIGIVGPGSNALTIDGGNAGAVLDHRGGGTLSVHGLSIINGSVYSDGAGTSVYAAGACVHASNNLSLDDVNISHCETTGGGNVAKYGGAGAQGGAVWAHGNVTLVGSTISDSSAVVRTTGYAIGGGLFAGGGLSMRGSTITRNAASSRVEFNSFGGGVFAAGPVTIVESTISANHADEIGGLDLNDPYDNPASLINSTVSGNTAKVIGGVFAFPPLRLYASTIAFNRSSVWIGADGQHFAAGAHVPTLSQMHSTIISNNVNTDTQAPSPTADLTGAQAASFGGGHNNVMFCDLVCPADTSREDPGLLPLQDNGGPTRTHVPTPGPWNRFGGSNERGEPWDQRGPGFPRESIGDRIEIGALQTNSDIVFVNGFN
jgi:hypothetical protein